MPESWKFLKNGMRINSEQEGFLIRVLWVLAVTFHIAWVCGFLGFIGFSSPFVQAGDLEAKIASVSTKQAAVEAKVDRTNELVLKQLRQSKEAQIRIVLIKLCSRMTAADRESALAEKGRLQAEYKDLNGDGDYREPPCEQLR